jgi:hypothetical protein
VQLADNVSDKLQAARTELSSQYRQVVQDYWQYLQKAFTA